MNKDTNRGYEQGHIRIEKGGERDMMKLEVGRNKDTNRGYEQGHQ